MHRSRAGRVHRSDWLFAPAGRRKAPGAEPAHGGAGSFATYLAYTPVMEWPVGIRDAGFVGVGIARWTTARVDLLLNGAGDGH